MRIALSTIGIFHLFDLARELHQRQQLECIFTGYPRFKLRDEGLPQNKIDTYPWVQGPYMAFPGRQSLGQRVVWAWERLAQTTLDRHVAASLPPCDVFVGQSGSALYSGRKARQMGARYVCDRGSSHIRVQARLLEEEHDRWGFRHGQLPFSSVDPRTIDREEAEYAEADCITVPSEFTLRSFVSQGVPAAKLRCLPYGVNLQRFYPTSTPASGAFNVLFAGAMSLRKGAPYLLQAYRQLSHPRKTLTFAGNVSQDVIDRMKQLGLWPDDAVVLGHVPQPKLRDLMSASHVLVLPSIEEGLALVQAQAMACACPVIATPHTGAENLFDDGQEGFIVPIRDADAIAERLQQLADDTGLRGRMGAAALARVQRAGGWQDYGRQALTIYSELIS